MSPWDDGYEKAHSGTLAELRHQYRPYDTLPAFDLGMKAHAEGNYRNPYDKQPCIVEKEAWDRGLECAARWARIVGRA